MRVTAVAGCMALALLVGGCDPNDRVYFRDGVGTQLYTADTASAAELQNIYLDYLCRQANSYVGTDVPSCAQQVIPANYWPIIVQAGLNDIDARCDSYLAWLDAKRRENAAVLAEIGAVRFAVDALTNPNITGVSAIGLAAISAAFGLANDTVKNFNSLLLQVDHTTVQTVVVGNRQAFRRDLLGFSSSIDNKPATIHTLRTYLSICMPMTIAANINSTVTVFKQTGVAPGAGPVLPTIAAPFTPRDKFSERPTPPVERVRIVPGAETIIDGYPANRLTYTPEVIDNILVGLCAPQSELTQITGVTKALLNIWEQTDTQNSKLDGKIGSDRERRAIIALTPCPTGTLNAFERRTFATGPDVGLLVTLLNRVPLNGELPATATLSDSRNKIGLVRRNCFVGKLSKLPDSMNTQVTPDLMRELGLYARRRAAAETPAAPGAIPAC
jgi:hypothetical protein